MTVPRRLPEVTEENAYFWHGGGDGELRILRCVSCRYWIHPPSPVCPVCLSWDPQPESVSGTGTVVTYTINHQRWVPGLDEPYTVAIVELPEQRALRLTTNIIDCPVDDVHIGQRVEVQFVNQQDVWLPLFRPAENHA